MDRPIGERVAVLETRVTGIDGEVSSLRSTRHEHANYLQVLMGKVDGLEGDAKAMSGTVIPKLTNALDDAVYKIEDIQRRLDTAGTNYGWLVKILLAVFTFGNSVAVGLAIWLVTKVH